MWGGRSLRGGGKRRERRGRSDPKSPQQGVPSLIPAARGFRAGAGRSWHQRTELQPHRHTHPPKKKVSRSRETLSETGLEGIRASSSVPLCAMGVAVGPLCLLALSWAGWHGIVPSTKACQQDCFVAFFPKKTQKKIPIESVEMLLCFGMRRNRHAPPGEVSTRAGGKGLGAGPGVAVVAGRRGKMVCALWGRSWSPRPPRSQFSTGGIT